MDVIQETDHSKTLEDTRFCMQDYDSSFNKIEVIEAIKTKNIKVEVTKVDTLSPIKVSPGIECLEQTTFRCDIPMHEVGLQFVKDEENVKEEKITCYDSEGSIKTEINDLKYEVDVEEHELKYDQLKYIKIQDYKVEQEKEHMELKTPKCYVLLNKLDFDRGQNVNDMEIDKCEQNEKKDASDNIDVDNLLPIKVSPGLECIEQTTFTMNEVSLEFVKDEENVEEEKITSYDSEGSIKTEITDLKYVVDVEHDKKQNKELETPKCYVLLNKLDFDPGQNVDMEINKCEQNEKKDTSDNIGVNTLSPIKVSPGIEWLEQTTFRCDISMNEVGLKFVKDEENVIEENIACYDSEGSTKTETNDLKYEVDVEEHELRCDQLKSIKIQDYIVEPDREHMELKTVKCYVLLNKLDLDHGQNVNNMEINECEQNEKADTSDDNSDVETEKQDFQQYQGDYCKYGTRNVAGRCKDKTIIERHQTLLPACKAKNRFKLQTIIKITPGGSVKYFKCQFCEYITKHSNGLKIHFTRKHSENGELYQCFNCKYNTTVKKNIVKHCKGHHNKRSEWHKCQVCDYKTKSKSNLLHHRVKHDDAAKIFHCGLCEYKTKYKNNLRQHHKCIHDNSAKNICCELCDFKTKDKYKLSKHHRLKHDDSAEILHCKVCDFKTKYRWCLLQHHKFKHDTSAEFFLCEMCDFKTKNKYSFLQHHVLKHDDSAEIFHCDLCNYKTKAKSYFIQHQRLQHSTESLHCGLCDYKTKNKRNFLQHHRLKHDESAEIFHCELCDFKTKFKSASRHHKLKHDDSAEIIHCKLCDYKTKYKRNFLQHHRSIHDDSVEHFYCALCNFKTKYKYYLSEHHKLKHGPPEILDCELCDFKTKTKSNLLRHYRRNHKDSSESIHCALCVFETKRKYHLLQHFRLKHGGHH